MKKKKGRIISLLLAATMLTSVVPATAFAGENLRGGTQTRSTTSDFAFTQQPTSQKVATGKKAEISFKVNKALTYNGIKPAFVIQYRNSSGTWVDKYTHEATTTANTPYKVLFGQSDLYGINKSKPVEMRVCVNYGNEVYYSDVVTITWCDILFTQQPQNKTASVGQNVDIEFMVDRDITENCSISLWEFNGTTWNNLGIYAPHAKANTPTTITIKSEWGKTGKEAGTKKYRLGAWIRPNWVDESQFSDEFTITWTDGFAFVDTIPDQTVKGTKDAVINFKVNKSVKESDISIQLKKGEKWVSVSTGYGSYGTAVSNFKTTTGLSPLQYNLGEDVEEGTYRIRFKYDGKDYYSNEFKISWTGLKFTQQPTNMVVEEDATYYTCTFKVNKDIVEKDSDGYSYKIEYKNGDKWDKLIVRDNAVMADTDGTIKFGYGNISDELDKNKRITLRVSVYYKGMWHESNEFKLHVVDSLLEFTKAPKDIVAYKDDIAISTVSVNKPFAKGYNDMLALQYLLSNGKWEDISSITKYGGNVTAGSDLTYSFPKTYVTTNTNGTATCRYKAVYDGDEYYSDKFTVTWVDLFAKQPKEMQVVKHGDNAVVDFKLNTDMVDSIEGVYLQEETKNYTYKDLLPISGIEAVNTLQKFTISESSVDASKYHRIHCKVKLKDGREVDLCSSTFEITWADKELKFTKQPTDIVVKKGEPANVTFQVNDDETIYGVTFNCNINGDVTSKSSIKADTDSTFVINQSQVRGYDKVTCKLRAYNRNIKSLITSDYFTITWVDGDVTSIPEAKANLVYNGSEQIGVEAGTGYILEGTAKATNAGKYTVTAKLTDGYVWSDGTDGAKTINWEIAKADPEYTAPSGLTGTRGKALSTVELSGGFAWENPDTVMETVGKQKFKATFTPTDKDNFNVINDIDIEVEVVKEKTEIPVPTAKTGLVYNGSEHIGVEEGTGYTLSGDFKATNANYYNHYTAIAKLNDGYVWADGSTDDKEITWTIARQYVARPTLPVNEFEYTGELIKIKDKFVGFDKDKMSISGDLEMASVNEYDYTVRIDSGDNYTFIDNPDEAWRGEYENYNWRIIKGTPKYELPTDLTGKEGDKLSTVTLPTADNGTWTWNEPETVMNETGEQKFTATFTPNDINNYNVVENVEITVNVTANEIEIAIPTGKTGLVFNGEIQTGVEADQGYTLTGEVEGRNAAKYEATAKLENGYVWADGTKTDKVIKWEIAKQSVSLPTLRQDKFTYGHDILIEGHLDGFTSTSMLIVSGGDLTRAVGKYSVTVATKDNYKFVENGKEVASKEYKWEIVKADPEYTLPDNLTGKVGDALSTVELPDGFAWKDSTIVMEEAGKQTFKATFTPNDKENYNVVEVDVEVNVAAAKLEGLLLDRVPDKIIYKPGENFDKTGMVISAKYSDGTTKVITDYTIENATNLTAGQDKITVKYTEDGETVTKDVKITVYTLIDVPTGNVLTYNGNTQYGVNVGQGYGIGNVAGGQTGATNVGKYTCRVYLADDYMWTDGTRDDKVIPWEIIKADPEYTLPKNLTGILGEKLSTVTLPDGFEWENPNAVMNEAGNKTFTVKFIPDDTNNYNVMEGIEITVNVTENIPDTYKITVVNGKADYTEAEEGTKVTITANVPDDKKFVNWTSEDGVEFADATAEETTFKMLGKAVTVTANLEDKEAPQTVEKPAFSPNGGKFTDSVEVSILCATQGAAIYYTTDGETWNEYTEPFTITETTTVKAYAAKDGFDNSDEVSATFTKVEDTTDEVTVTFDSNGGSKVAKQTIEKGAKAEKPSNPKRSGYTFRGWYEDEDLKTKYDFSQPVNEDITLYARWRRSSGSSSSSSGTAVTYKVVIDDTENGAVESDKETASKNTTVTITVKPDKDYEIRKVKVVDSNNNEIKLTDNGDGIQCLHQRYM